MKSSIRILPLCLAMALPASAQFYKFVQADESSLVVAKPEGFWAANFAAAWAAWGITNQGVIFFDGTGVRPLSIGTGLTNNAGSLEAVGGSASGSVTSVDISVPTGLAASGGPVTDSGTLALSWSGRIPDSSVPTNVARVDQEQTWTAPQYIGQLNAGAIAFTGSKANARAALGLVDSKILTNAPPGDTNLVYRGDGEWGAAPAGGGAASKRIALWTALDNCYPTNVTVSAQPTVLGNGYPVTVFSPTLDTEVHYLGAIPAHIDLTSGIHLRLSCGSRTNAGNVVWRASIMALEDGAAITSDSYDTATLVTNSVPTTEGAFTNVLWTLAAIDGLTAGKPFCLKLESVPTSASFTAGTNALKLQLEAYGD